MKTISALTLIFLSTCFCGLYSDESAVEYFNLTHEDTSFTLGEERYARKLWMRFEPSG
jgi:hypothetical protein